MKGKTNTPKECKTAKSEVIEKSKTICVKCEHAIMVINKPGEGLCILTTRNKTMDYVTGKKEYTWSSVAETRMYGEWWESRTYKQKRLWGIFPRKLKVVNGEKHWAKNCRNENINGNCPTFKQKEEPVVQEETK